MEKVLREQPTTIGADISDDGTSPLDAIVLSIVNALPREARLALSAAPARPDRSAADAEPDDPMEGRRYRGQPLRPEVAAQVSDEAIDEFRERIGAV